MKNLILILFFAMTGCKKVQLIVPAHTGIDTFDLVWYNSGIGGNLFLQSKAENQNIVIVCANGVCVGNSSNEMYTFKKFRKK